VKRCFISDFFSSFVASITFFGLLPSFPAPWTAHKQWLFAPPVAEEELGSSLSPTGLMLDNHLLLLRENANQTAALWVDRRLPIKLARFSA